MPAIRVLHVIPSLDATGGGVARAAAGMAAAQKRAGLEVSLIATRLKSDRPELADSLRHAGVNVHQVEARGKLYRSPRLPELVERGFATCPDVVHLHAAWEEIQSVVARKSRRRELPYVVTPHGMLDPWSFDSRSRWKKKLFMVWRVRRNLNTAAALHFATTIERDVTARHRLRPPAIVEPFGIDHEELGAVPAPAEFRERFQALADRPYAVFLGRQARGKGLEVLIPAFGQVKDRMPQAMLVVAGPDWENLQAHWQALANQHGVSDRVLFTGMLHGRDRLAALAGASVFALPSAHENFGIAVIEALACGVPVIVSDQVYIHPEIAAAKVGEVIPREVPATADALVRWLSDPALRAQAAERARAFAASRYDWDQIGRHWAEHYQRIAAGHYAGRGRRARAGRIALPRG